MKRITIILLFVALVSNAFAQHPKKAVKAYATVESRGGRPELCRGLAFGR